MALIIRTNGTVEEIQPKNGTDFALEELYAAIDTDIVQVLHLPKKAMPPFNSQQLMVMDEEGKGKGKAINETATTLMLDMISTFDVIVGDVVVCRTEEFK